MTVEEMMTNAIVKSIDDEVLKMMLEEVKIVSPETIDETIEEFNRRIKNVIDRGIEFGSDKNVHEIKE